MALRWRPRVLRRCQATTSAGAYGPASCRTAATARTLHIHAHAPGGHRARPTKATRQAEALIPKSPGDGLPRDENGQKGGRSGFNPDL
eukprot:9489103-Pyramimonas_sp.AAC.1